MKLFTLRQLCVFYLPIINVEQDEWPIFSSCYFFIPIVVLYSIVQRNHCIYNQYKTFVIYVQL